MKKLIMIKGDSGNLNRFINPLTEKEWQNLFVPDNAVLFGEGEITNDKIRTTPLIQDGYSPVIFNPEEARIKYMIDGTNALTSVSLMLYVTGYLKRERQSGKAKSLKTAFVLEWAELFFEVSSKHGELLRKFIRDEKSRDSFFELDEQTNRGIEELNTSRTRIMEVSNDLKQILGRDVARILSELD